MRRIVLLFLLFYSSFCYCQQTTDFADLGKNVNKRVTVIGEIVDFGYTADTINAPSYIILQNRLSNQSIYILIPDSIAKRFRQTPLDFYNHKIVAFNNVEVVSAKPILVIRSINQIEIIEEISDGLDFTWQLTIVIIIPLFIGVISALISSGVFNDLLKKSIFSPKLKISFDGKYEIDKGTHHIFYTDEKIIVDNKEIKYVNLYIRALIENISKVTAKSCRAFITKIEKVNDGQPNEVVLSEFLGVSWAYHGQNNLDIPAGISICFDIATLDPYLKRFIPETERKPNKFETAILPTGKYVFFVIVSGEQLKPLKRKFYFEIEEKESKLILTKCSMDSM